MQKNIESIRNMLRDIPTNLFIKDTECRYVYSEHYWDHLEKGEDGECDIFGKTDVEIRKDKKNAQRDYEEDKKIIKTGCGCRYIIKENFDGKVDYLEIIKNPIRNENGEIIGIVGLINNLTDVYFEDNFMNSDSENDFMTCLYSKNGFLNNIDEVIDISKKQGKIAYMLMMECVFPDCAEEHKADSMILAANTLKLPVTEDKVCARIAGEVFAVAKSFDNDEQVEAYVKDIENRIKLLISAFYTPDIKFACEWRKIDQNVNAVFDELYNTVSIAGKMLTTEAPEIKS